jgi:hypothetical protein
MKGAVTQLAIGKILGLLFIKMLTEYDVPSQLGGLCEASKRKKKEEKKERQKSLHLLARKKKGEREKEITSANIPEESDRSGLVRLDRP